MGYSWQSNEKNPWFLTLAERAMGSPANAPGLDEVDQTRRLAMGALLFNDELDAVDQRAMKAFKSPLDMAHWLTSGIERWGVDPKFAPMRAFERALALRSFLGGDEGAEREVWGDRWRTMGVVGEVGPLAPSQTAAASAWMRGPKTGRNVDQAAKAMPKSAFALLLRRRALPAQAVAGHLLRNILPYGAVGMGACLGSFGAPAFFVGAAWGLAAIAKAVELVKVDHHQKRQRLELAPARESLASNGRLERLRDEAIRRGQEMGMSLSLSTQTQSSQARAASLRQQAQELQAQAKQSLRGTVLESLAHANEAAELREKAKDLIEQARKIEKSLAESEADKDKAPSRSASHDLLNFSFKVHAQAASSMRPDDLQAKSQAALDREQVAKVAQEPKPAPRPRQRL